MFLKFTFCQKKLYVRGVTLKLVHLFVARIPDQTQVHSERRKYFLIDRLNFYTEVCMNKWVKNELGSKKKVGTLTGGTSQSMESLIYSAKKIPQNPNYFLLLGT